MRISDWSSDVCSSDLPNHGPRGRTAWPSEGKSPFYSFNPNPLRYTNNMADKACHVVGSTTQVGLTQALDFIGEIACICKEKSEPSRLLQRCSCLHFLRLAVAAVVPAPPRLRSEEHTSELQSLMRTS